MNGPKEDALRRKAKNPGYVITSSGNSQRIPKRYHSAYAEAAQKVRDLDNASRGSGSSSSTLAETHSKVDSEGRGKPTKGKTFIRSKSSTKGEGKSKQRASMAN